MANRFKPSRPLEQWSQAYPHLTDPDQRVWALYRIGLCEQRLGRFEHADATFAQVQKQYPGTVPAARAREKQGVVVDAWLDLKDRAIKGPGMTERTTYLIVGERPIIPHVCP